MPEKNSNSIWPALSLAGELGYIIALPIVIFGFLGAHLDKKYGTGYWFLIVGVAISAALSSLGVYRKVKKIS